MSATLVAVPTPAPFATALPLAGRWRLTITDIVGDDDARWTIGAVPLRIALDGATVRGTVRNAMPDIACQCAATHGDALPPVPPMGPLDGTIDGETVTMHLGRHWTLVGSFDATGAVLAGRALYREHAQGVVLERRGRFVAVRLPR